MWIWYSSDIQVCSASRAGALWCWAQNSAIESSASARPAQACEVLPSNLQQHLRASQLRQSASFSFWHSLIVAAALDAGCDTLYSEDMQHGRLIDGRLTIVNPLRG